IIVAPPGTAAWTLAWLWETLAPIVPLLFLLGGGACFADMLLRGRFVRGQRRRHRRAGRCLQANAALPGEYPPGTNIDRFAVVIEMLVTHERHTLDRAAKGVHDGLHGVVRRRALEECTGRASGRHLRRTKPRARLALVRGAGENIS